MWWIILIVLATIVLAMLLSNYEFKKWDDRSNKITNRLSKIENFKPSNKVVGFGGFYTFAIDNESEKICYVSEFETRVLDYKDIIGVEIIEDGITISKKTVPRMAAGVVVGKALAGNVGAIIGGLSGKSKQRRKVSTLSVKILLRDTNNPSLTINCFDSRTMTTERKKSIETEGKLESHIYKTGKQHAETIEKLVSTIIDKTHK